MTERIDTKAVLKGCFTGSPNVGGGPSWCMECHSTLGVGFDHKERCLAGALAQEIADREADRKLANEWDAAARHLLEHYPEDLFPPNSNTPDAKAGTFARRLLTWLLDPVERARFAALAEEKKP